MIVAEFTSDGSNVKVHVTGHAGYAESGSDIVCAAASMLFFTAAQNYKDMYKSGMIPEPVLELSEGDSMVSASASGVSYAIALHTLNVIRRGFDVLSQNYPGHVSVKRIDTDK